MQLAQDLLGISVRNVRVERNWNVHRAMRTTVTSAPTWA